MADTEAFSHQATPRLYFCHPSLEDFLEGIIPHGNQKVSADMTEFLVSRPLQGLQGKNWASKSSTVPIQLPVVTKDATVDFHGDQTVELYCM
jgi:hypothetical protein